MGRRKILAEAQGRPEPWRALESVKQKELQFIQTIRLNLDDPDPKLVYANWFEAQGALLSRQYLLRAEVAAPNYTLLCGGLVVAWLLTGLLGSVEGRGTIIIAGTASIGLLRLAFVIGVISAEFGIGEPMVSAVFNPEPNYLTGGLMRDAAALFVAAHGFIVWFFFFDSWRTTQGSS